MRLDSTPKYRESAILVIWVVGELEIVEMGIVCRFPSFR
jgi:hypothetical protein